MKLVTGKLFKHDPLRSILIHTSVKLVTSRPRRITPPAAHLNPHARDARDEGWGHIEALIYILIHTSVKLVTVAGNIIYQAFAILIHTSVKLVTWAVPGDAVALEYFNPHEREARDLLCVFLMHPHSEF